MLPRVSAALAQFIAPIATSAKQGLTQQGFDRFVPPSQGKKRDPSQNPQSGQHQQPSQPQAQSPPAAQPAADGKGKVIPFPGKSEPPPTGGHSAIPSGISHALLQLLDLFKEQRTSILRWIGTGTYQLAARQQKKNGRIRKGTILDEKAE